MTTYLDRPDSLAPGSTTTRADAEPVTAPEETGVPTGPLAGVPGLVGLPVVIAGGTGLAITDLGLFPAGAGTATLTILLGCTVIGLAVATVWAAALGDSISASLYAIFGGFYASDVVLSAAGAHGWFGSVADLQAASNAWLVCWLVMFTVLLPLCLRLPAITTIMLVLVEVAVVLLLVAGLTGSTPLLRLGALGVIGFVATVAWQYADLMLVATGGRGLPMGKPVVGG